MIDPESLPVPDLGLRCHRCGYPLAGLPEHRCPECGRTFTIDEHIPPGDFPQLFADGQEVRAEQHILALLRTYQIPWIERTDAFPSLFSGSWVPGQDRPARIGVPRERYFEAIELMRRSQLGEPLPPVPGAGGREESWLCPHCEEVNPPNFEVCWNCGEADAELFPPLPGT